MNDIRDPSVDHPDELYPQPAVPEELDDVLTVAPDGSRQLVVGDNVDEGGVAHFLRMTADPDEPDVCGGCGIEWQPGHGVPILVSSQPTIDPEQARLEQVAYAAARQAVGLPPLT